ncbi:hypothetical protein DY000_02024101 [Brassica cretica]|uniref:Secreted protein n=1 Tax=Brassica cretica TaxID=69181 RepID=A0ABQ7ELP3_BRACR|nr:hypothetical protein DY000_02024101 [Brassica cretica]
MPASEVSPSSALASSRCCRLVCLTLLRYARCPWLGFGPVVRSAAEEYGSGGLSAFSGVSARKSSGFGPVVRSAAEEYGSGGLSAFSGVSARKSSGGVGRSQILVDCLSDLDGPYSAGFCPLLLCASVDFTTTLAGCGLEYAGGLVLEVSLSRVGYALVFVLKYTLVLNVSLPWQVKAFSSSNFSSPVLGDYRRSVVLVSFAAALSRLVFAHFPASLRYYEVFGKLFPDESLSLRVDSSGMPKLPGSDSRLNLARLLTARSRLT